MKPLKTKVSITLDNDLVVTLKEMAEDDDRSFSQYINLILKDWVLHHNNPYNKTNSIPLSISSIYKHC